MQSFTLISKNLFVTGLLLTQTNLFCKKKLISLIKKKKWLWIKVKNIKLEILLNE